MSLNSNEITQLVHLAAGFVRKIQANTAIADTSTHKPVLADFPHKANVITTAAMAKLINRYFNELDGNEAKKATDNLPET